jgi:hypothetical protein
MTKIIYEEIENNLGGKSIKADLGNGTLLFIPIDEANSDYQAYLNKDNPEAEQSTPIVIDETTTK